MAASAEVSGFPEQDTDEISIQVQMGDPDFRGFEIARTQFFGTVRKVRVTFSMQAIVFSMDALQKLNSPEYVELLVHPKKRLLAVRKSNKSSRNSIKWASGVSGKMTPKYLPCAAYISTLFSLFGWNESYRYRAGGVRRGDGNDAILLFDLSETEILIPAELLDQFQSQNDTSNLELSPLHLPGRNQTILAYPQSWAESFGAEYYQHVQADNAAAPDGDGNWNVYDAGTVYSGVEPQPSSTEKLEQSISQLIHEFREEEV